MLQPMLNRIVGNISSKPTNKLSELTEKCRHKNKFKLNKLPT